MRIGILTLHSQLNYGGVLQCWALKTALEQMGHEVVVVDRWLSPTNSNLDGPFAHATVRGWIVLLLRSLLGCGTWCRMVRHWRTRRFVRGLGLTEYHFCAWVDAPKNLGVDCLVVGSDQVWHAGDFGDPRSYLLEGAPSVRAIAYAASFGMCALPEQYDYAGGFKRFAAIGVREREGVELVLGTGYSRDVKHVVDPTLLVDPMTWRRLALRGKKQRRLVCYFMAENLHEVLPVLDEWSQRTGWKVYLLCDQFPQKYFPKSIHDLGERLCEMTHDLLFRRTHVLGGAGPIEFLDAFAHADACITDSFHALMFSSIYNVNCRFLRPHDAGRKAMLARVEEFAEACVSGDFFAADLNAALESIACGKQIVFDQATIKRKRDESMLWLKGALHG